MTAPLPIPLIDATPILLDEHQTVLDGLKMLNRETVTAKIVLIINAQKKLVGSVVDGDVRRGLLKGATLQSPLRDIMHPNPATLPASATRQQILEHMRALEVKHIPLLNDDGCIAGIAMYDVLIGLQHARRPNRVVIMAGGKGKRLLPITTDIPKPMVPVGGKPMLEWILLRLTHYGFYRVTLAVNYLGHIIEDYFGEGSAFGCDIEYVREKEFLGTAGALSLLESK
ncbi:MAG: NTP transferase domain-containing protein, partial [Rickettsiales bacterium]|nr:NTP transferase domain-containing protein [Rickettsiales bacterium]